MKFAETINGYNAMGREDAEYEACYAVAERHTVGGRIATISTNFTSTIMAARSTMWTAACFRCKTIS